MTYDSAIQAAQLIADEMLNYRRDGEEMAWVSVCRGHSYTDDRKGN